MSNQRGAYRHKKTMCCPIDDCNYTSRHWIVSQWDENKKSHHSKMCPIHRVELIEWHQKKTNELLKK